MSRAAIRSAVAEWFKPPAVEGLNKVFSASPVVTRQGDLFEGPPGAESGAVAHVYLPRKSSVRASGPVPAGGPPDESGWRLETHECHLLVIFTSLTDKAEDASAAHDELVDAIDTRIQADFQFGTDGNPIFSAGEGDYGIQWDIDLPKVGKGSAKHIWAHCMFQILSWTQS